MVRFVRNIGIFLFLVKGSDKVQQEKDAEHAKEHHFVKELDGNCQRKSSLERGRGGEYVGES